MRAKSKKQKPNVTSLLEYLKGLLTDEARVAFASECHTTIQNLYQIGYGGSVSAKLAKAISEQSGNLVPKSDLRPDIFTPESESNELANAG